MFARASRSAAGVARHLERDVEALDHAELALDVVEVALARVDGDASRPSAAASSRRHGVRLADDDVAGAGVAGDGRRHEADRPGAD